jgi:putative alpha-1,2-mannosidase
VNTLLETYFKATADGLPVNNNTATMSAWVVFFMMGIYPITFSLLVYAVTTPSFDEIEIRLDTTYYPRRTLVIKANDPVKNPYIKSITIGGQITKD